MTSSNEKSINYSFLCLSKLCFLKHGFEYQDEELDTYGIISTKYKKNNEILYVHHRFFGDSYTISFDLHNPKHHQILKSKYLKNGEIIGKDDFFRCFKEKISQILPKSLMTENNFLLPSVNNFKSKVYMDIAINYKIVGRISFKLFDNVPHTSANIRGLCVGENFLCYVGTKLTHIFPQYFIRGGDISNHDGTGGESIYGKNFPDENFNNKHCKPGILSMFNSGPDTNGSQFFITCLALPYFDNKHVVVGELYSGMDIINIIMEYGSITGNPSKEIIIANCGLIDD